MTLVHGQPVTIGDRLSIAWCDPADDGRTISASTRPAMGLEGELADNEVMKTGKIQRHRATGVSKSKRCQCPPKASLVERIFGGRKSSG